MQAIDSGMATHEDIGLRLSLNDLMKIIDYLNMKADYRQADYQQQEQEKQNDST
jgi:hypothetical protein